MSRRTGLTLLGAVGLFAVLALGWYLASPLFIDDAVDEAFPFEVPSESQIGTMSAAERQELEAEFMGAVPSPAQLETLSSQDQEAVADRVMAAAAAVMMDKAMDEASVSQAGDEWLIVGQGQFMDADSFHMGSGSATIFEQGGQRVLRLEEFSVTNGPDLHVILSTHPAPADRSEVGEDYIDLGSLKGNVGNQNYEIAAGVDLSTYQSVVIYCVPFHVVFATATLSSP